MLLDMLNKGITDFNSIDVSKITNMTLLFCTEEFEKVEFDISEWDVSHVEDMENMFTGCSKFNCDLSKWDVSHVEDMRKMFKNCTSFNQDISKWDVNFLHFTKHIFRNCKALKSVPSWISMFDEKSGNRIIE